MTDFINDRTFDGVDFTHQPLEALHFDQCTFLNCNFEQVELADIKFLDCTFRGCNLSLAKVAGTLLSNTRFEGCKILGVQFGDCSKLGFTPIFEECVMDNCSFYKVNMKGVRFNRNRFREADFIESDMSGCVFDECDFLDAVFQHVKLEKADFRTSFAYTIDPETNRIKKAVFSLTGLPGLLHKWDIKIEGL